MRFEVFGDKNKKAMVLVQGYDITWRMWMPQIKDFSKDYYVIVPVLSGHDEEDHSEFISVQDEVKAIIDYVKANCNGELFALCGASLGGTIAFEILSQNKLKIQKAIIDGGIGVPINKKLLRFAINFRVKQKNQIKNGDEKLKNRFKATFYPSEMVEEIFKVCGFISDRSCKNVHESVYTYTLSSAIQKTKTDITYWQGSKERWITKKTSNKFHELLPNATIEIFKGCDHGELCIGKPAEYIEKVRVFFAR